MWGTLLVILSGITLLAVACETMGTTSKGSRLKKLEASSQYTNGQFVNKLERAPYSYGKILGDMLNSSSEHRNPREGRLAVEKRRKSDFAAPESGLRVTWFGHSTFLVELDDKRLLIDPVWGERVSPFTFAGPKRYVPPVLPLDELPEIDAVLISHDHYDHLDHPTIVALAKKGVRFVVPLGVGAHLSYWKIPAEQIVELDWWDSHKVGDVELTATPARHFSGRGLTDRDATLWSGWSMRGPEHRVFYSGDTAMHDGFVDIGKRLGPFDMTLMESGAYNQSWADVHMGPEQAMRAHQLVGGKVFVAAHWGLFDLSLHSWVEPIERVLAAAEKAQVTVVTPRIGGQVELGKLQKPERWWPADVPWRSVEKAPVRSSNVDHLMGDNVVF
ncbi:MAG: hypothetical protein GY822_19005 [Deltaproteobacteria bacterium]|nr:hypothetical protein [Deltaproteobacteria bacterium]